jgi:hypothetical protein
MKRNPWDALPGQYRAAGEGPLGQHQGKPVFTIEAAEDRREHLAVTVPRTWIESYQDGGWKRITDPVPSPEPNTPTER